MRSGRVPSIGTSVPIELRCVSLQECECIHHNCTFGIFMEVSSYRHTCSLMETLAPLSFSEDEGWVCYFQDSNLGLVSMAWSRAWTSFHHEAIYEHTENYLIKTKTTTITKGVLNLGALCEEPESKRPHPI